MENRNRVYNVRRHENFERIHKREDYVTLLFPYMNMDASEQLQLYSVSFQSLFKKREGKFSKTKKKGYIQKKYMYIHTYIYRRKFLILGRKNSNYSKEQNFFFVARGWRRLQGKITRMISRKINRWKYFSSKHPKEEQEEEGPMEL